MATADEFGMSHPANLRAVATLEQCARDMQHTLDVLTEQVDSLMASWSAVEAEQYHEIIVNWMTYATRLQTMLTQIHQALHTINDRCVEMRNLLTDAINSVKS